MASMDEKQQPSAQVNNAPLSMYKALQQAIVVDSHRTLEDLTRELLLPMLKTWLE